MTQTAQIKQTFPTGTAMVAVVPQGACAHNCSECYQYQYLFDVRPIHSSF